MFKSFDENLGGGLVWSFQDQEDFVEFSLGQQQDAPLYRTESDIAIAIDSEPQYIVLSQVSDFFAGDLVKLMWRPVGERGEVKVLEYKKAAVLTQLGLPPSRGRSWTPSLEGEAQ